MRVSRGEGTRACIRLVLSPLHPKPESPACFITQETGERDADRSLDDKESPTSSSVVKS